MNRRAPASPSTVVRESRGSVSSAEEQVPAGGRMEEFVSRILQTGVLASAALVAAGLAWWHASGLPLAPGALVPSSWQQTLQQALRLYPPAVVQAGLGLLLLTPIFRVAASVVWFWKQRDWTYVVITATVLALLLGSLLVGSLRFASSGGTPLY